MNTNSVAEKNHSNRTVNKWYMNMAFLLEKEKSSSAFQSMPDLISMLLVVCLLVLACVRDFWQLEAVGSSL